MRIFKDVSELVGNTPLLDITDIVPEACGGTRVLAKLECFNPTGSAKARPALNMIKSAEEKGVLKKGSVIIEPTSGNTGIGLAAMGGAMGYKVIIVMPDTMSEERILLTQAYGAEVVLTPGDKGVSGSIEEATRIAKEIDGAFIPSQFDNPENPRAHYLTTAPEIWNDTEGEVDIFVAGIGTGGTISGVGEFLKEKNPDIKIVGVEPDGSPILNGGKAGTHSIQGIGANFVPKNFNRSVVDEIVDVSDASSYECARQIARGKGVAVGISSGAVLSAARVLAARPENNGKTIVVLFTDAGERYLSTELYK